MSIWGVLVVSHGSSKKEWLNRVYDAVKQADISVPWEMGFLEMVPEQSIQIGVNRLEAAGVTDILVIPLFVSLGSTHIDEIRYAFGLIASIDFHPALQPIDTSAAIHFGETLDDHPLVVAVLLKRLGKMSRNPAEEHVVLVGHGSDKPGYLEQWHVLLQSLSEQLMRAGGFASVSGATTLPNTVKDSVSRYGSQESILVLPLFLSEGYFTNKVIPDKLAGLAYVYTGEAYLPHPNISRWIVAQVGQKIAMKV